LPRGERETSYRWGAECCRKEDGRDRRRESQDIPYEGECLVNWGKRQVSKIAQKSSLSPEFLRSCHRRGRGFQFVKEKGPPTPRLRGKVSRKWKGAFRSEKVEGGKGERRQRAKEGETTTFERAAWKGEKAVCKLGRKEDTRRKKEKEGYSQGLSA